MIDSDSINTLITIVKFKVLVGAFKYKKNNDLCSTLCCLIRRIIILKREENAYLLNIRTVIVITVVRRYNRLRKYKDAVIALIVIGSTLCTDHDMNQAPRIVAISIRQYPKVFLQVYNP